MAWSKRIALTRLGPYSEAVTDETVVLIGLPGAVNRDLIGRLTDLVDADSTGGARLVESVDIDSVTDPGACNGWRRGTVVWLDGSDETLAARADGFEVGDITSLRTRSLRELTTAADVIVDVDDRSPDVVAETVRRGLDEHSPAGRARILTETVAFDDGRSYQIHIGRGATGLLADVLPKRAERIAVVTQPGIGVEVDSGRDQRTFLLEPGEQSKRLDVIGDLASALAQWGMTRADAIVSVGGGVVSDVAGFLAASYHRGLPVVHVSTTLLGQVDAAIGGKTGVNLPEGKNLIGAFWQPAAVLCEIEALETLPPREFVAGMGELAKYHFIGGGPPRPSPPGGAGGGSGQDQGRCRLGRRARGRTSSDPELRPHAGPRLGDRRLLRPAARRRPSASAWSTPPNWRCDWAVSTGPGSTSIVGWCPGTACRPRYRAGSTSPNSSSSSAGTRRR